MHMEGYDLYSDGYQQAALFNGAQYHALGSHNEVTPVFYQPMDAGCSQAVYSSTRTPIPAFSTINYFYGAQLMHPDCTYLQAASPECKYWSSAVDVPAISRFECPGTQKNDYLSSFPSGENYFSVGRPALQPYVMVADGPYSRGIFPTTNPAPVNAVVGNCMRSASTYWMEPTRRVKGHQKNSLSLRTSATSGNTLPTVIFPSPQPQQAVYSPHVTSDIRPPTGKYFGISSPGKQRSIINGVTSNQSETVKNNWGWSLENNGQLVNEASLGCEQGMQGGLNDEERSRTARSRTQWLTINRQEREKSEKLLQVDEILSFLMENDCFNRSDFVTKYDDAKFFVIKSYSEDDIHKSIKYNLWASTPIGNLKLNQAYKDAQKRAGDKPGGCPVFFFFSVNGSGRFCGLAEMVGPVDFTKSMDFWQQGKWNGSFSVRWHIIKDIHNSQLRHILLKNNDNKPVTNSRDAQEVSLAEGLEMLNIFKNCSSRSSILDNFYLYESRQRALQDKRDREKAQLQ
eukprot:Gb_16810 [translate_table: standard]